MAASDPHPTALRLPAMLAGIALGGFFDGILLHQVLQWHHLLSGLDAVDDPRMQILADGLFHAAMYGVALAGLALLWARRASLATPDAGRRLATGLLAGFGGWHVADAILSHGLLGLHRIRMDVADPLPWDLGWLVAFGVLPLALAWWWRRAPRGPARPGAGGLALGIAALVGAAALTSLLPPRGAGGETLVIFAPSVPPRAAFHALAAADARIVWVDRSGGVWAVQLPPEASGRALLRAGGLVLAPSGIAAGCAAWTRAAAATRPAAPLA